MVSRFFSAIGEVLAPTLQTPLEDFRLHWRAIKHFYIDDKDDVEGEGIPEHLNHMIQILLEEADAMDGGRRGTGPCLEFFLQERILPILCHLGETDRPPGMRGYVLVGVSTVVRNMPGGLLFNMHVHEPIRRLLATAATSNDHAEVISLAHAVVVNISKEKVGGGLGTLFLHPPDAKEPEFVLLAALLPRIELPGFDGEQARQALVQIVAELRQELLRVFEDEFVLAVLGPALLQPNDAELAVSTRYVGHIIDHTEPPLLHALLNSIFPIGKSSVEESMGILAASITTRVAAANEDVRHSDLQLIDNALNQALTLLVCPSSSALMTASNGESKEASDPGVEAARAYLALFPARDATPTGYEGYLADAHHALSRPSAPTSPSTLSSSSASLPGLYSGEPLVQALWQQVGSFLDQSLDTNLVLTSAIGKMAVHPHPARCAELGLLGSYQDALSLLRARMLGGGGEPEPKRNGTVLATPHVEGFLQALLLLQEFQKEIAAIMHASALVGHHHHLASPSSSLSPSSPSSTTASPSTSRAAASS
ncbi:uncharacterized protein ACA1_054530 [Acanthamoeba castellanii str. Neff]|uniref:Uncharacterized protein n=1 Tax=Acanthamoeba castellanii (strain ATCC 30010 / Neff) TaxID=1257118 RepID=L8H654_ACACF|nr:uncharacterized protein ACA1_054530 [Acanthamoeba castellanii str. Neff]ELR20707.1 hypothetical protein ACA1_054530 [Acanthamoeba castellanii str. Neff]